MPTIKPSTCACSQELEQFHNHQGFTNIRVKGPVTHLTTMMKGDGGCRCKEDNTFSDFTLGGAKEIKSG